MSAGSHPAGEVHPHALALLHREGISTTGDHADNADEPIGAVGSSGTNEKGIW